MYSCFKNIYSNAEISAVTVEGNLTKHIRSVHMNDRPYSCEFCTASFAFKDGLQRHRRSVHSSTRRFKCEKCGVAFNQAYQLRRHSCEATKLN